MKTSSYTITETLQEGRRTTLVRAVRNEDGRRVILKMLDPRRSRPRDAECLKHEHAIIKHLDLAVVVTPLALETIEGMPALVMEDDGGESLDHVLGAPMAIERFLALAVQIAAAVAEVHERDIIHRDLKPHNILLDATTGRVKLADFGLASRLPREYKAAESPSLIEGSLPYLSPEQTGRMSRAIDNRADLYALGVTFYELLTGRLPFEAKDPLEWVHCHVARVPPPPSSLRPALPEVLSALVMKLLAKMAEDRYQTARGLQHDLERCLAEWRAEGRLRPFPLAQRDVSGRFQIPQKLYGREDELATLLSAFERVVATGSPELLLVSGYSGIGKSALVHELHKPVVRERGFFIVGKFDQYERDIPYSTIVQAFRALVLEILAESEERLACFRERLVAALGINAQLIVDVIPQVELVVGRQPPVVELRPTEAQNRFRIVFRRFIGVFARKEHPLALFLDDLQWADSASLGLLHELVTHPEIRHLLVIGAYRDNEVNPSHPLMLTVDKAKREGARVSDVVLGPLSREYLAALVSDTIRCGREAATQLAELIHEKTAGNPFFAIQFFTALHDERLVELDGRAGVWRWDVAKIRAKSFTDNVVELMVRKLVQLPSETREALEHLAALGNHAEAAILAIACGQSEDELRRDLWEAARAGLVLRLEGTYKFLHDRVQEAAYSLIPEALRAEVHLRIGRRLLSRLPAASLAERIFDVVNQLDSGAACIVEARERATLCGLNARAGRKAKASIAYASARNYLAQATALLPADAWSEQYEDTFALYMDRSECEYLAGDFQRADALFDLLLENARSRPDRTRAYRLRMRLYQIAGRFGDALAVTLEAARLFGVVLPECDEEIQAAADAEIGRVTLHLSACHIADLVDAPVAVDADVRALIGLLAEAMPLVYTVYPELWPLITAKGVNVCLEHGHAEESPFVYSCYAMVSVAIRGDIPSAFQLSEMALALNERLEGAATLRGKLLFHHGAVVGVWSRHFAASLPILEQAFLACLDAGDLVCAGYLTYNEVWLLLENGAALDHVVEVARKYTAFAAQSHNDVVYNVVRVEEQLAASLKGATRALASFSDDTFDEDECIASLTKASFGLGIAYYHIAKQVAAFIHERYAEALECGARAALMLRQVASMVNEATYYFYHALTLTALYPQASAEQQRGFADTLAGHLQKLELWADNCPENFLNRHALVSAEVARIEGRALDAEHLYEVAIRSAHDNGFVHNEGIAYELASRFYRARGFDRFADAYLREARACYARWGADGKVEQLDQQYPRLFEPISLAPAATFAVRPEQLDLLSVTRASQTISSEIVLDQLVRTLLTAVLEQGGAQRACLIRCRGSSPSIEADAALDEDGTTSVLGAASSETSQRIPRSLVRYVERTRESVVLHDAAADADKFAGDDYFARHPTRSVLCMPILRQAEVVDLLYLENDLLAGAFTPDRLVALSLLATQAAISLQNARLLAKEQTGRAAAEAAERRAAFLAEAGALLSESLDYEETLARVGRLAVRSLCDWCVFDLVKDGELMRIFGMHGDPAKACLLEEMQQRYPPRRDSPHPASMVLRTGEPLLFPELTDEVMAKLVVDDEHLRLSRELGAQSSMIVPLVARGQTLGVLSLVSAAPDRRYGDADLALAQEVARRAAMAVDNAHLYRKAQRAISVRDEFLSVASHELNTPLHSLTLSLHSLMRTLEADRPSDPRAMSKMVDLAVRQASRLRRLNRELLDVSQIHAGQLYCRLAEVDLGALVREVLSQFELELTRARCAASVAQLGPVVGRWDRSHLDQVVTNLLSNAIKFGTGKPIEISLSEDSGTARLAVRDHGIGIDPAQQGQIFERFERAVSGRHYGGLGLGLYISRRLVEAQGGTIGVRSELGAGATFTVELPCAGPPLTAHAHDSPPPAPPASALSPTPGRSPPRPLRRSPAPDGPRG